MLRILTSTWVGRMVCWFGFLFLAAVMIFDVVGVGSIKPPRAASIKRLNVLHQNWNPNDSYWFHHASQGTKIMRYDWFMALEQAELLVTGVPGLFHESEYLERFGFLPDENSKSETVGLPVGFATEDEFKEPFSSSTKQVKPYTVVGLTCAACHTGQIEYQGEAIRINGAGATIDLGLFQDAVRRAMFYTLYAPGYFGRFADRVLGANHTSQRRQELFDELKDLIAAGLEEAKYAKRKHLYDMKAGPGRTDALGLIGNRAFKDLGSQENLAMTDAPVNFPPLWDTPWFDWVQYNASIRPPMVRNIGEALGVGALVVTDPLNGQLYDSTVNVKNLHEMESQIAGPRPFEGLRSPAWPIAILGELNSLRVKEGRTLFQKHCVKCHLSIESIRADAVAHSNDPGDENIWVNADALNPDPQYRLIHLDVCNLQHIGTDPAQALNLLKRVVFTREQALSEGIALLSVTAGVRDRKYKEMHLTEEQKREYDGHREPPSMERPNLSIAANLGYRPRPLDGVWATGPYLHNGSVPNLFELLSPVEKRSKIFYTGGREFDPVKVGLTSAGGAARFRFDASIPGNLNTGHEFRNLRLDEFEKLRAKRELKDTAQLSEPARWASVLDIPLDAFQKLSTAERQIQVGRASVEGIKQLKPPGVLGPEFSNEERWALIEYLKSL